MLAPNKESIYPEMLSRRASRHGDAVESRDASATKRSRTSWMLKWSTCAKPIARSNRTAVNAKCGTAYISSQDSHWSPAGVEVAARAVAQRILELGWSSVGYDYYDSVPAPVSRLGDLVRMLQVPLIESSTPPEEILCRQIVRQDTQQLYEDDPAAAILVLGDSFLRIYQQDEPGAAGFIAHLAKELQQPLTSAGQ